MNRHARHSAFVGLLQMMPITATLAMVASAAMAGVAVANGSCRRKCSSPKPCSWTPPQGALGCCLAATVAGMFSVAYSLRFTVDVFFGPPATDLPHRRTSPALDARARGAAGAHLPARRCPARHHRRRHRRCCPPRGGGDHPRSARRVGTASPAAMVMSLLALAAALPYLLLGGHSGSLPLIALWAWFDGAHLRRDCSTLRSAAPRAPGLSTRRLQWQMP